MRRAVRAVYYVFFGAGFAFASWASRIPQVRDGLRLSPGSLGLLLLSIAAGSLIALPLAGTVVARLGAARTITLMTVVSGGGLATAAVGYRSGVAPVVVGLFVFGAGNGTWDVAMNVEGTFVEQCLGRAILPRFHAGFSIGTVAGALLGAAMVALGVSVTLHLLAVALLVALGGRWAVRGFLTIAAPAPADDGPTRHPLQAWLEPRTLLLGFFVFCMAFIEGTGVDWLGVAVIDGYRGDACGRLAFARSVPRGHDDRPLVRPRAARSLRSWPERARLRGDRMLRGAAGGVRRVPAARARRNGVVGHRQRAGLSRRHERRRRRSAARSRARRRGHVDRLRGIPRGAAVRRPARQRRRHPAFADRRRCARRCRAGAVEGCSSGGPRDRKTESWFQGSRTLLRVLDRPRRPYGNIGTRCSRSPAGTRQMPSMRSISMF